MAFTVVSRVIGEAIEKGLSSAIKVGDLRWSDHGLDFKKSTKADNTLIGPVAFVTPDDSKVPSGPCTITKMYFNVVGGPSDSVKVESSYQGIDAAFDVAMTWVATVSGESKVTLTDKYLALV